jgi:hypothetical protein
MPRCRFNTLSKPILHSQSLSHSLKVNPTLSKPIPRQPEKGEGYPLPPVAPEAGLVARLSGDGGRRGPAAAPQPQPRLRRSPRSASYAPTCGLHCRRCSRRPVGRQQALPRYPLPRLSIDYITGSRSRSVTHPHHMMTMFRTTVQ